MPTPLIKTIGVTRTKDLAPMDVERLFDNGYRDIEILPDGTLRETIRGGRVDTHTVTRPIKTERTWY